MAPFWNVPIAREWRDAIVTEDSWEPTEEERPGGEAEGFFVQCGGRRAYLKPSKADQGPTVPPRAAHEKIAADLAFELDLPLPPAILVDGTKCKGKDRAAVLSLVMFPEVHKWSHAISNPSSAAVAHTVLRKTNTEWSGMLALDTWLANTDRENASNLLVGTSPDFNQDSTRVFFCDMAYTMIHSSWGNRSWETVAKPPILPVLLQNFDKPALMATIDKIRASSDETIRNIVERIPASHLSEEHKALIVQGLCYRKDKLVEPLSPLL